MIQQSIYDGLAWLDLHWTATTCPKPQWRIYYFYCVERAMDLLGIEKIGGHDWFAEMAETILAAQSRNGGWSTDSPDVHAGVLDTSFAILFLRRATRGRIPYATVTGGYDTPPANNR